jgi:hypothetical protein
MPTGSLKGVTKIEIAPVAEDGGMAADADLIQIGATVKGSVTMTTTAPTFNDIFTEESTLPYDSITTPGPSQLVWSTYDITPENAVELLGGEIITGTAQQTGVIDTKGAITGGTGGTNGTYTNVALTGGTGVNARATIVVSGGGVTAVTITNPGSGYTANDSLTATSGNIGNTTGFAVVVATVKTVAAVADKWAAPSGTVIKEMSIRITTASRIIDITRTQFIAVLNLNLTTDKIGQIDVTAKVLEPTKSGAKSYTISR